MVLVTKKCYPSNLPGKFITNALTGQKYSFRTGSKESLKLFKTMDTSGLYNSEGVKNNMADRKNAVGKEPNHLYYDNPNEYMQHRVLGRDPAVSDRWREYQKRLVNKNGNVDLSVFNSTRNIQLELNKSALH